MQNRLMHVAVMFVAACLALAAQQPPPPQGRPGAIDVRAPDAKGTASIRGQVVAADTGRPIRGAQVSLMNIVAPAGTPTAGANRNAYADGEGRFGWTELPAGKYRLTATTQSGYCTLEYGADAPGESGTLIEIADGQMFDKADLRLPRGGVVSGRVVDEAGEPVQGVQVDAYTLEFRAGVERLRAASGGPVRSKASNDRGEYRIYGLPPGEYYIAASPAPFGPSSSAKDLSTGYAVTYHPGTTGVSEARPIAVTAAGETEVNLSLVPSRGFEVSGMAVDASGAPMARAALWLMPSENPLPAIYASATTAGDGTFTFPAVPAGKYLLQSVPMPGGPWAFVSSSLNVASDTKSLSLQAKAPVTASGEVTFDQEASPFATTSVRVAAWPADPARSPLLGSELFETPKPDGTFDLTSLWGPRYIVVVAPAGWGLKSVRLNGADVTDKPVDFERERAGRLQIALTNRITDLSGVVTEDGRPVPKAAVLVFSSDRTRWSFASRFAVAVRADDNGHYHASALPAGEYHVIALPKWPYGWQRSQVLDPLVRDSSHVTLGEGERATLDLKIVKAR